ncbi:hypothetical protein Cgig2_033039 [Carnegiea gigantea]|uniref:RING-type domain-containing protein n=1 Tax=Carnegiea gigantea TaxID=171969 RepID=A0A9Q1K867_9CARY|nr:hypothetical protein Cgig2_033039 [Carnegiea gigantea]
MGQKQSREKLLYEHVVNGNVGGIRALSRQGASLEWKDKEGRTPLIVASKNSRLYHVAMTLIELGANVNAFSKGHQRGTPLHYAARAGLHETVALLLSHGANPSVKNSKHETPLDVARKNEHHGVVREIESRICYFADQICEVFGRGFSDASAPHLSSRVIWVVIVPRSTANPPRRPSLEFVIYSTPQDAEPRKILSLRRCKIKGPKFLQPSPALIIFDKRNKTRYKFTSVTEGDKQQLRRLYNACKGISQVTPTSTQTSSQPLASPLKLPAMASPSPNTCSSPWMPTSSNICMKSPRLHYNHCSTVESWVTPNQSPPHMESHEELNIDSPVAQTPNRFPAPLSPAPSAPPITSDDLSSPTPGTQSGTSALTVMEDGKSGSSNLCIICWGAPVEGACVPCGHMPGCMSCLKEVKVKNGVCPVCRSDIDQVIKLYGV